MENKVKIRMIFQMKLQQRINEMPVTIPFENCFLLNFIPKRKSDILPPMFRAVKVEGSR